jgi:hypothetical protein
MKIAIFDGLNQDIGLKILFMEADYFIHNDEDCTRESRCQSYLKYNFIKNNDLSQINDSNYDYLFIILPLYNILKTNYFHENTEISFNKIINIINNNNFKFVAFFDNYDFDYDPTIYIDNPKINIFFKRNYNKTKKYKENVVPFPFIMFGEKSLIEKCDTELVDKENYFMEKVNRVFFTGTIFSADYNYPDMDIKRDRKELYDHKLVQKPFNWFNLS